MTTRRRRIFRNTVLALAALFAALISVLVGDGWYAFGARATGERRARIEKSPEWQGSHFENPQPMTNFFWPMITGLLDVSPDVSPRSPVPLVHVDPSAFNTPPATGVRATWLGHSTVLLELDGYRILTDPIWNDRAGPYSWIGPQRWFVPPLALADLPRIDAVLISHDHYDHLDHRTITAMNTRDTKFIVPLGIGAHLEKWGVKPERIVELDWWERTQVGALEVVSTPSRHASGRALFDDGAKLWGGFAMIGPAHRVYYSGDTGLFPAMRDIGERLGPFDLTMIEVGQYGSAWPDWHLGPEQAVIAHTMVRGRVLLPVHWGAFALAYHAWTEPIERMLAAAQSRGVTTLVPRPGQMVEPDAPPAFERWWPDVSWRTGTQDPIVSSLME